MTRHKRYPAKGGGRNARKNKFRPQDPVHGGFIAEDVEGKNEDPKKGDGDIVAGSFDSLGSMVPGIDCAAGTGSSAPESKRERRRRKRDAAPRVSSGPKARDGPANPSRPAEAEKKSEKEVALRQRKGETVQSFAKRTDQHLKDRLKEADKKVVTSNARDKKRKARNARHEKTVAKAKRKKDQGAEKDDNPLFQKAARPEFGDVIERPPTFGADAMKSQAKLKARADGNRDSQGKPGGLTPEMQDYASKVREAYAALKKRRGSTI